MHSPSYQASRPCILVFIEGVRVIELPRAPCVCSNIFSNKAQARQLFLKSSRCHGMGLCYALLRKSLPESHLHSREQMSLKLCYAHGCALLQTTLFYFTYQLKLPPQTHDRRHITKRYAQSKKHIHLQMFKCGENSRIL